VVFEEISLLFDIKVELGDVIFGISHSELLIDCSELVLEVETEGCRADLRVGTDGSRNVLDGDEVLVTSD
jgi:hypothetical protein